MAFSKVDLKQIEQTVGTVFCGKHSPAHLNDKLRLVYAVKDHEVVIAERRPRWDNETEWTESPVAKLKFIRSANKWRLYWMRADMKWHEYPGLSSSTRLEDLVQEINTDPCLFFRLSATSNSATCFGNVKLQGLTPFGSLEQVEASLNEQDISSHSCSHSTSLVLAFVQA
ncbi:MAG: DUF3024 domain-containing protein [Nitrospiraceae bacterium]